MRRFAQILFVVTMLFSVNVYANAIGEVAGTFEESACEFQQPSGVEIDCGYLTVPENYEEPDGVQIRLAVAILRHPDGNPEPDPILYLEGGPGGSALELLYLTYSNYFEPMFAANRDIILLDQRGVGLSEPALDCTEYLTFAGDLLDYELDGEELTEEEVRALDTEAFLECGRTLSAEHDLTQYNSVNNAADLEALRLALGIEQINVWGISYGTRLGLTYMRDYPQGIRSVILDSVVPLETEFQMEVPDNYNRSLDILFADCAADTDCAATYPNLEQVYYDTIDGLNETPARFDSTNPLTGQSFTNVLFNGNSFSTLIFNLLYDASFLPAAPQFINEVAEGDYETLAVVFGSLLASRTSISNGMNMAFNCHEEFPFIDLEAMEANFATFPGYTEEDAALEIDFLTVACGAFESGAALATEDEPVSSDLPTLVVAGEYDPVTPPSYAEQAAVNLSNSTYVEFPASGHGPTGTVDCAQRIATDFFVDPTSELDTSCVDELVVDFVVPGEATAEVSFEALDLTEFNINATTIIPEGWERTVAPGNILVYARGDSALDQTGLTFIPLPFVNSVEQVTTALGTQFDIGDEPEQVLTTDNYEWSVFALEVQGFPGYIAVTLDDDGAIILLLLGEETLVDSVLVPIMEAFAPVE